MKFNKKQHQIIINAVRSYIKHLELIEYEESEYLDKLKNFLGKLLRETDWSYILWSSPEQSLSGKILIVKSSLSELPRKSRWILFKNGQIKLVSFFKNRRVNLIEELVKVIPVESSVFGLSFKNSEYIEVEADKSASKTFDLISSLIDSETFTKRMLPALFILDSIDYYRDSNRLDLSSSKHITKILDLIFLESYGLKPKYVKYSIPKSPLSHHKYGKVKLEIGLDSLLFLENTLSDYIYSMENSSPIHQDLDKAAKAKKLLDIFAKAHT